MRGPVYLLTLISAVFIVSRLSCDGLMEGNIAHSLSNQRKGVKSAAANPIPPGMTFIIVSLSLSLSLTHSLSPITSIDENTERSWAITILPPSQFLPQSLNVHDSPSRSQSCVMGGPCSRKGTRIRRNCTEILCPVLCMWSTQRGQPTY